MRPALVKRTLATTDGAHTRAMHACWQHAHVLEDDTFNVPGYRPIEGAEVTQVQPHERDDAGVWCAFCE